MWREERRRGDREGREEEREGKRERYARGPNVHTEMRGG